MGKIRKSLEEILEHAYNFFNRIGLLHIYIPRWIILFLDIFSVAFAFIFIFFLFGLLTDINVRFGFFQRMAAVVSVYFVMELVFKVYRGTIRYSGLSEAVRLFFYVVISMGVTIPVMIYLGKLSPVMKISNVWLLVHGATTFFIMFGLRILIRYAYYFLTTDHREA